MYYCRMPYHKYCIMLYPGPRGSRRPRTNINTTMFDQSSISSMNNNPNIEVANANSRNNAYNNNDDNHNDKVLPILV